MPDRITVTEITGPNAGVETVLQRHHNQMRMQSPEESCHVMTGAELRASGARIFAGAGRGHCFRNRRPETHQFRPD